ncbi:MAG: FAD-binding oxidoreductase [Gammaproteobacteria bacterium]|nr:FAD-binding oxidoreductase [Gammaproteobacteria bacterium]MDE0366192.1 FAD-binding oxidoreductase [Gammaproteobacteria bacterium]
MPQAIPHNLVAQTWSGPLEPSASVPEAADVVVIGGGIVGISTAWFLARQGIDVVVCEKGHVAGEQSGRNWGWVRQQGRDTRELPMIVESLRIWRQLGDAIGEDVGFREQGILYLIEDNRQFERYAAWMIAAEDYGIGTRLIEGEELKGLVRGSTVRWRGALYTASDGRAEPHKATPALARAAAREGATVLSACAVRGIESSAGRVSAVVTEHGTIRTSTVLCAAGAWTSMFCRTLGITVPQLRVRGTVARTAPANTVVCDGSMAGARVALRRRLDGGYTLAHGTTLEHPITPSTIRFGPRFLPAALMERRNLRLSLGAPFLEEWSTPKRWPLDEPSPFEQCRVLDPRPNDGILRRIRRDTDALFPDLAGVPIVESWAGMIEMTPDVIPVIDQADALPGFFVATGFSGHGFGIGPGAGKAIAGLLTGDGSGLDLHEFRLGRFFDGTPIRPQTSV